MSNRIFDQDVQNSRRNFLTKIFTGLGLVALFLKSEELLAQRKKKASESASASKPTSDDLPLVTPGQGMAKSVNYVHDKKDLTDKTLKTERQGVKFENQQCSNCILYTAHGKRNEVEVGKCQLFPNQVVKASGWCSSWAKKG
ncbi:MAG: high-potential iron-sulfur protein [Bdellovibrionaceae bacterium]|nr:high-potential iron-sulfur protein [Pseudobdellovibrionaceae bacterium]MDW8189793.1 high-potential iron-sulfur protein [Pseudobdellovibrionaceae bacterium]